MRYVLTVRSRSLLVHSADYRQSAARLLFALADVAPASNAWTVLFGRGIASAHVLLDRVWADVPDCSLGQAEAEGMYC
jgi:hypothetical protein